ncbi:Interferon-related developmental regulator N-terminal domain-containing protein [[Candida] zeylanoides]
MSRKPFGRLDDVLSNTSSRSQSRVRTPQVDGEENGALDVNFNSIEDILSKRLESLQLLLEKKQKEILDEANNVESNPQLDGNSHDYIQKMARQMNQSRIQSSYTSINEIIASLEASRNDVSSQSRELLLAQLYRLIVAKPLIVYNQEQVDSNMQENYIGEDEVARLLKNLTAGEYRSATEFLLLLRSCVALLCSDIDEFGGLISTELMSVLSRLIHDPATAIITNENKSSIISGVTAMLMVLHNGSTSFGLDEKVSSFLEVAEGFAESSIQLSRDLETGDREYSTLINDEQEDKRIVSDSNSKAQSEASVAVAALHGCGCLLTLLGRGDYLNEFVTDITPKLVTLLDNDVNIEISKAAGRVIALCYEVYTYAPDDEDGEEDLDEDYNYNAPFYEQEQLLSIVDRLANLSSHKITKKDKKVTHSIFRDIASTIRVYTDSEKRIEVYKRSPLGVEYINSMMDSSYVKLSKSRTLAINSWFLYLRLIHLKWCFSFGVHSQLVSNESIRDILREPQTDYQAKYGNNDGVDEFGGYDEYKSANGRPTTTEKKRSNQIRKARVNKLTEKLDDLGLVEK